MTPNREDYLKIILELGGDTTKVNNKQIVSSLDVSAASVSEMISKLVKEELVEHSPYQGVQLTASGLQKASSLIRKHRLWEVFLVEHLDYSWNEVHDDAEVLEHVTSEHLADHLENYLNHPEHCPMKDQSLSKMIERKYPSASRRPARFLSIKYKGVYLHV